MSRLPKLLPICHELCLSAHAQYQLVLNLFTKERLTPKEAIPMAHLRYQTSPSPTTPPASRRKWRSATATATLGNCTPHQTSQRQGIGAPNSAMQHRQSASMVLQTMVDRLTAFMEKGVTQSQKKPNAPSPAKTRPALGI